MDKANIDEKKEKLAALIREPQYKAMTEPELAYLLQVPPQDRALLHAAVDAMLAEGLAVLTKREKLMPPEKLDLAVGVFTGNERGFGFVSAEGADVFIPPTATNGARHKDKVLYQVVSEADDGSRAEGEIVKVLSRGLMSFVGTYNGDGFVTPDDKRLPREVFIQRGSTAGAVEGHKVLVRLTKPNGDAPMGAVSQILGHVNDPGVDVLSIVLDHGIPTEFPAKVQKAAARVPDEITPEELVGRADFRGLLTVTIDGDDAKDLDDAVSLERLPNGNTRLGVHIADVSHYVRGHSALDEEALLRGTSVYLVDRVIPMLPHALSNGICSLHPHCDRLTLSCVMELDSGGNIVSHEILESVIHGKRRLSYDVVNEIITGQGTPEDMPAEITSTLMDMAALSAVLREKRSKRGAIEFNLAECKVRLDDAGKPVSIEPYTRNAATGLIEEFMLICNETVAEDFFWQEAPFVYRTHEEPDEQKLAVLGEFAARFGYHLRAQHAKSIQALLAAVDKTPEEMLISRTVLRSMKQARYTPECTGHYGLAAKYYCHFTSPIRRYPDLQIHRIIKAQLHGELDVDVAAALQRNLPTVCAQASSTERRAEAAERDAETLKKVEFMADKIGEVFKGIVSGVTAWGVFVEMPNTIEGLLRTDELPSDDYIFDERQMRLAGRHRGYSFAIGDKLTVRVSRADVLARRLEFALEAQSL